MKPSLHVMLAVLLVPISACADNKAGGLPTGAYECWANGEARLNMNFTVKDGGSYAGPDGDAGTYSLDDSTKKLTFKGGSLDGAMPDGFFAEYKAGEPPTVSFVSGRGSEAAFCQRAK